MAWRDWVAAIANREWNAPDIPGESGPYATREVHRDTLDPTVAVYQPDINGTPDPGEVIWTWVPFEESDRVGKDRPVLILVAEAPTVFLGVYLTSRDHSEDPEYVSVGSGPWDTEGRESWANTERLFRVHTEGMRREGAAVSPEVFDRVLATLGQI